MSVSPACKHTFGVAYGESQEFSSNHIKFDGIMGLARSSPSGQRVPTPVESLVKQGLISQAITSYKISRVSDGEITFGGRAFDINPVDLKLWVPVDRSNLIF